MSAETNRVDVEISVVNTDNKELLSCCLGSLAGAAGSITWRATVVDNASSDGSSGLVRQEFPAVRLLQNDHRRGFSANHNRVINDVLSRDSARYVLVLNEDTELAPGSLERLILFADKDPTLGAIGPRLVGSDGREQSSYFAFPGIAQQFLSTLRPGRAAPLADSEGWLNGSCLLLRTQALSHVGGLDERFFIFYEDTDLGLRLQRKGWRSAVCDSARVIHHEHQTVASSKAAGAMEQQMLRSRYLYFRKHHGATRAWIVVALVRLSLAARAAKALGGSLGGNGRERTLAQILWALARYNPGVPLAHEPAGTARSLP
jgi:N-acetylglucosaminyl-diphospho-decaprenol L-rhamnosyltransferase